MTISPEGNPGDGLGDEILGFEAVAARLREQTEVDATLDQVDQDEASFEAWETEWSNTLEAVRPWGPRIATAYRDARQAAGNTTVTRQYGEHGALSLDDTQERAERLQPDVLIVDIVRQERSWRSPIRDTVGEQVSTAGWTISRREYPSPEVETEKPVDNKAESSKPDLLDALDADDVDEGAEAVSPEPKQNMLVERVVLMQDGKLVRMVGNNDGRRSPSEPLRFARVRPDRELKTEDPDEYKRQEELLGTYKTDNAEHFVQPGDLDIVAILKPDTIADVDLGQLPEGAAEDEPNYELEATMVSRGLARFLARRGLADAQELADLRAL